MTEAEKAQAGFLYDPNDTELASLRERASELCYEFNMSSPKEKEKRNEIIKKLFKSVKGDFHITPPFHCDYGSNISIGNNFYTNFNCIILDGANVEFGDYVFIAPNCTFTTAAHPIDCEQRNEFLEIALPIKVGNNVWIGANVTVLPGVSIGDNSVIGAGSIVNKSIPENVVAAGNPCRVIREITEEDKNKYPYNN